MFYIIVSIICIVILAGFMTLVDIYDEEQITEIGSIFRKDI